MPLPRPARRLTPQRLTSSRVCWQVHLTTDMGKNWKRISTYVAQFEWGAATDGMFKPGMTKETIFM